MLLLLLFIALGVWIIVSAILRHRSQIVSVRGMSTGADIGRLHDLPRVQVRDLTMTGPESARLTVASTGGLDDVVSGGTESSYLVSLSETDPGFGLLHEWIDHQSVLGIVLPPDTRLLRLRSLEDLQPLTLRRLDT